MQLLATTDAPVTSSREQLMPSVRNRNRLLFCGQVWFLWPQQQRHKATSMCGV